MAEFNDLDELLSGSLKRAAQPGDSAGVADTIRARVAAGDTGTPAPNGSAPGFGGGVGWIPWIGVIVVLGLVGGTLGATGAFGRPAALAPVSNTVLTSLAGDAGVDGLNCPTGSPITEFQPGQHVLALARTADSADIEVRDPAALNQTVWVTAHALKSLGKDFSTLPVSGCGVLTATAVPAPVVTVVPVVPVNPPKPKDTTSPAIGAITIDNTDNCKPIITAQITDNIGVTGATLTATLQSPWPAPPVVAMTHPGGPNWKGTLTIESGFVGVVYLSITARDAAGNTTIASSKFIDTPGCPVG